MPHAQASRRRKYYGELVIVMWKGNRGEIGGIYWGMTLAIPRKFWRARRDSNSRPIAPEAIALSS